MKGRSALMALAAMAAIAEAGSYRPEPSFSRPWPTPKKPQTKNQKKAQRRKGKRK